jgi:hypothetical protein
MICQCKNCQRQVDIPDDKIPKCGWPLNWHCSECGAVNRISWHRKAVQNSSMTKLEWSEEQQVFHYNSAGSRAMENSNGFQTIMECADEGESSLFAYFLQVQYLERGIKLTTKEAVFTLFNLDQLLKKIKPAGATR